MRIAVVGGGVSGLSAGWRAKTLGAEVVLCEASSRLGGQVMTEHALDCVLEHGAEGFVANSTVIHEACNQLDLASEVISQATSRTLLAESGGLREMSAGEAGRRLGIQGRDADWGRGLHSLRGGMGRLVDELAMAVGPDRIRRATTVAAVEPVERRSLRNWLLYLDAGETLEADGLIVALPGAAAATVLRHVDPEASDTLQRIETVSSVSVTLVVAADSVRRPGDATGLVVADPAAPAGLLACSFTSAKFAGRSPPSRSVLRAFYRLRADEREHPEAWIQRTHDYLEKVIGLNGDAEHARVWLWPEALPRYAADHDATMAAAQDSLRRHGRLELAGASVARSGLDGAVSSGQAAADRLLGRRSEVIAH